MSNDAITIGSKTTTGGEVTSGASGLKINGVMVALVGDIVKGVTSQGYVKCSELTKISTRYISRAYAKTPEICEQLVEDKSQ